MGFKLFTQTSLQTCFTVKNVLLSKISILHIFDRFGDHTSKKKNSSYETSQTSAQLEKRRNFAVKENEK